MKQAIFESTGQAIHVAFLIMAHEPRQGSPFRNALLRIMEAIEHPTKGQREWMAQLRGEGGAGTINFEGLTSDEIRAQCAMITQAVRDHLPDPERFAILSRFAYQVEKAEGIAGLAEYVQPLLKIRDIWAIRALIYAHTMPHQRERGLSYLEISKDRGIPVITLRRSAGVIAGTTRKLEAMAVERLRPMFTKHGVIETEVEVAYA
jgi:hypothetical protein